MVAYRYGLPADRLWISVYEDDDETFAIWHNVVKKRFSFS